MELRLWPARIVVGLLLLGFVLGIGFGILRQQRRADMAGDAVTPSLTMGSASFADSGRMPPRLTCDGGDHLPEVHWQKAPPAARSFAILLEDRDAPFGFVHWLAYNLPATSESIAEGDSHNLIQGKNSADRVGYMGPCPPGSGTHRYMLRVYALDLSPDIPAEQTKQQLAERIKGHVVAEGRIIGLYSREKH